MGYFPTSGDGINASRKASDRCFGNFCEANSERQDGLPIQGVAANERKLHRPDEWFCLAEGSLELNGDDNVISALMKSPEYSNCDDEYSISKGDCPTTRVYFPLLPIWDLNAITPLQFPGCCTPAVGPQFLSLESGCDGTWASTPCLPGQDVDTVSGNDLLAQMGCSCVRARFNGQSRRWESDYAPDRYLALIANDEVNSDGTINVTPYYISRNGQTVFYRNEDCSPVVFSACRGEGIPEDFIALPCPLPEVEDGLGCCTFPDCDQSLTTQVACTSQGGTWEAGIHCDADILAASTKIVVFRRRSGACCWVAEQEEFLTRTVSPTLTNPVTGMSEQNLVCLFPGKLVQEYPTAQYGWCTTTDCEIEDVWLWIANDPSITEISPSDVYIGHKIWRDYNYLGDVRNVYVIEYSMGVSCEAIQNTFSTNFNGFVQEDIQLLGFWYDEGAEEWLCVNTDVCGMLYSEVLPYATGATLPDGHRDDFILGFGDNYTCTVMNLCDRLQEFDLTPPTVDDNVRLIWNSYDQYEDTPCRWAYVCDIMEQAFPLAVGEPPPGAEWLYIENDTCHRTRIYPGAPSCENLLPVFDLADYHDNNALVFGWIPGAPATCHTWTVCELLMSEAYVEISNENETAQANDWLLGFHPDPDNAGQDPLCTYGSLCHRLNQLPAESPLFHTEIFWTDGFECRRAETCDFIENVFDSGFTSDIEDGEVLFIKNGLCKKAVLNVCQLIADDTPTGNLENGDLVLVKTGTGLCEWKTVDINELLPCGENEVIGGGGVCIPIEECPEPAPSQTEMA